MTNPQYQKLYNVAHRVPLAMSPLLWSIQSLFQSQPVPVSSRCLVYLHISH